MVRHGTGIEIDRADYWLTSPAAVSMKPRQPDLFVTPTSAPFKEGWNCDPPRTPQLIRPSGAGNSYPVNPGAGGAGRARHPGNQP